MEKVTSLFGNAQLFLRTAEHEMLKKLFVTQKLDLSVSQDPATVCERYTKELDREGIMDNRDTVFRRDGNRVAVEIGTQCPYRQTCTWIQEEGLRIHCFRAVALTEVLRLVLDRDFEGKLDSFGIPCKITLSPTRLDVHRDESR